MKKRIVCVFLMAALIACSAATAEIEASAGGVALGFVRTVSKYGTVWLRTGGGTGYAAIGYATNGDSLTVRYKGTYWYRVTLTSGLCKGLTGWMYSRYIDCVSLKSKNSKNGWGAMARIRDKYESKDIRLRSGPGSWYSSRATVDFDDPIIILSKTNSSWYLAQIGYTRKYGYIYSPFITNGAYAAALVDTELYKRASASSLILDTVLEDEEFIVKNVQSKWSKVEFEGYTGYIRNSDYEFQPYIPLAE